MVDNRLRMTIHKGFGIGQSLMLAFSGAMTSAQLVHCPQNIPAGRARSIGHICGGLPPYLPNGKVDRVKEMFTMRFLGLSDINNKREILTGSIGEQAYFPQEFGRMKQIERYIFRRVFILSAGTLATTTVIALTTQVLLRVNLLSSTGQSVLTFLELAGLLVPPMMLVVMPFALMIGAAQTLSTMNSDSELAVIEASGGARHLVARPILCWRH